jgi:hypothetical protein
MRRMWNIDEASRIDTGLDSRAVTFENPDGLRGGGGQREGGRKGRPARWLQPGERVVLCDIEGPGVVRHIWMTIRPAAPEEMRAVLLEGFYDGASEPSISVPAMDFFGCAHGRPVAYASALTAVQEGRGFNAYFPMPFRQRLRLELENAGAAPVLLFYQVDYTLQEVAADAGLLHVTWRRENPTTMQQDFSIAEGLRGPGRFLGCVVGVRVLDAGTWYGEGELKVYRDGDGELPTICGTGLEDYVGTAWGMGPHHAIYAGAPLEVRRPESGPQPDFVGFYRWHVPDPIVFEREVRVTIQQIGYALFREGEEAEFEAYKETHPAAGRGWAADPARGIIGQGIVERVDDYSAAAFVYCMEAQAVKRVAVTDAVADIGWMAHEGPNPDGTGIV